MAPGKRHIVVQCNNVINKAIILHLEAEGANVISGMLTKKL